MTIKARNESVTETTEHWGDRQGKKTGYSTWKSGFCTLTGLTGDICGSTGPRSMSAGGLTLLPANGGFVETTEAVLESLPYGADKRARRMSSPIPKFMSSVND